LRSAGAFGRPRFVSAIQNTAATVSIIDQIIGCSFTPVLEKRVSRLAVPTHSTINCWCRAPVEALCPQADQTAGFKSIVDGVLTSIPRNASSSDRDQVEQGLKRLAARQSVRSAYLSKIKQLIGDEKAKKFDALYVRRSNFLHDGTGRGTLGDAASAALDIGLELLLADIAQ
jgi:hypothetical protein